MSNFKVNNDGTFENSCHGGKNQNGICCTECIYFVSSKDWLACNESCFSNEEIKMKSCLDCKHKPNYIHK